MCLKCFRSRSLLSLSAPFPENFVHIPSVFHLPSVCIYQVGNSSSGIHEIKRFGKCINVRMCLTIPEVNMVALRPTISRHFSFLFNWHLLVPFHQKSNVLHSVFTMSVSKVLQYPFSTSCPTFANRLTWLRWFIRPLMYFRLVCIASSILTFMRWVVPVSAIPVYPYPFQKLLLLGTEWFFCGVQITEFISLLTTAVFALK